MFRDSSQSGQNTTESGVAEPDSSLGPSRRRVVKYGLFGSTAVVVGLPRGRSATAAADSPTADHDGSEREESHVHVAMFPHQFAPGARFRIERSELGWRPDTIERLEASYTAHAIDYDFSRSFGAFVFVAGGRRLESDSRYALGETPVGEVGDGRSLVSIDVEPVPAGRSPSERDHG